MSNKKTRIVKGICDSYVVTEEIDPISGKQFLEVYEHVTDSAEEVSEGFVGDWICDIDCTMSNTDAEILDEIDANI